MSRKSKRIKEKSPVKSGKKVHRLLPYLFIVFVVFILYGNTIYNKYAMDDHLVAIDNYQIIKGIGGIPEIFTSRYSSNEGDYTYGYRPIVLSTFAIEYSLWGENPYLSHLINILLYGVCCILLFLILKRIFKDFDPLFPLLVTIIFAAHPVHTEVVASLKNRDELLSLACAFGTLLLMLKYADTNKIRFFAWGLFLFLISYFSKATSIPYLVLIPLTLFFFTDIKPKKLITVGAGLLIIILIARFGPKLYLPEAYRPRRFFENNIRFEDLFTRISTGMYILYFYLKKLLIPFPLLFYYGYNMIPIVKFNNPIVILSFLFHTGILVYALLRIKNKDLLSYIILFYLVSIAMYTNIVRPAMGIVAERFLLTPSLAFSLFLVFVLFRIIRKDLAPIPKSTNYKNKIILLSLVVLIPYTALTINRNRDWKNYLTLYTSDIGYLENSVKANILYAQQLKDKLEKGDYLPQEKQKLINTAINHYKQALKIYPDHDVVWNNLATMYTNFLDKNDDALLCVKKAIELNPEKQEYFINKAMILSKLKEPQKALSTMKKAYSMDTTSNTALFDLVRMYSNIEMVDSALFYNNKLMHLDPESDLPWINFGNIAMMHQDTIKAVKNWEKAISLNPGNTVISNLLYRYYHHMNNQIKAQYYKNLSIQSKN